MLTLSICSKHALTGSGRNKTSNIISWPTYGHTYCASTNDLARLDAFLRRSKRYCADDTPTISEPFAAADQSLFQRVLRNELHVLQPLLPEKKMVSNRNLRPRQYDTINTKICAHQ